MAAYPMQQNAVPISMSNPFFRTQFGGAPLKQHGVSVIPPNGSFLAGTTEPWYIYLSIYIYALLFYIFFF